MEFVFVLRSENAEEARPRRSRSPRRRRSRRERPRRRRAVNQQDLNENAGNVEALVSGADPSVSAQQADIASPVSSASIPSQADVASQQEAGFRKPDSKTPAPPVPR